MITSLMRILCRYMPELILLVYIGLFVGFKQPAQKWDRVINSDGKGYYAYLPAIFIYQDLDYCFVETYESDYYPSDRSVFKEFRLDHNGQTVNKYFAGLAILWLPFFLLAHIITLLAGMPADGYSIIYQYTIAVATLFYLWAGCRALFSVLIRFGASQALSSFILLAITLGTNMVFYAIIEPSMSHIYSFSLITLYILSLLNYFATKERRWFLMFTAVFGLIVITRPTNVLVILLLPFMAGSIQTLKDGIKHIWKNKPWFLWSISIFILIIALQPLLYYFQSGQLWIYSYGEEQLEFINPKILNILFSFNRGWFIYTPLALFSLTGLIALYRDNKFRFISLIVFFSTSIYLISCWWVFYYASKCGQRVFIDLYPVLAILLIYLFSLVKRKSWRVLLYILTALLILLNMIQFYQHTKWIFPVATITGSIYWDAFTTIHPKARVYLPEEAVFATLTMSHDMEKKKRWMNEHTLTGNHAYSGNSSSLINDALPYGIGLRIDPLPQFETMNRIVKVTARIWSAGGSGGSSLVLTLTDTIEFSCYRAFYLEPFIRKKRWIPIECAFSLPDHIPENTVMKIYFYHPHNTPSLYIDDLTIDFISLKDRPEYKKIEGVLVSCH